MTWIIVEVVFLGLILSAFHVWIMAATFTGSRWQRQLVDTIVSFAIAANFAIYAATGVYRKSAFLLGGLALAMWVLRTARFLLHKVWKA